MIDKELFPEEYEAIQRLKDNSRRIESLRANRREQKLKRIEQCRRELYGAQHSK